jgi:hypothetical protein
VSPTRQFGSEDMNVGGSAGSPLASSRRKSKDRSASLPWSRRGPKWRAYRRGSPAKLAPVLRDQDVLRADLCLPSRSGERGSDQGELAIKMMKRLGRDARSLLGSAGGYLGESACFDWSGSLRAKRTVARLRCGHRAELGKQTRNVEDV